jgi:hypothetical protein
MIFQCACCAVQTLELDEFQHHTSIDHDNSEPRKFRDYYDPTEPGYVVHHYDHGFLWQIVRGEVRWTPDITEAWNLPAGPDSIPKVRNDFERIYAKLLRNPHDDGTRYALVDQTRWEWVRATTLNLGDKVLDPFPWAGYTGTVIKVKTATFLGEVAWHKWPDQNLVDYIPEMVWQLQNGKASR